MQRPSIAPEICFAGRVRIWTLPVIATLLRQGLTARDYEALALVADQYGLTVAELMALAFAQEGGAE